MTRLGTLDLTKASKAKKRRWEQLRTEELKSIYEKMGEKLMSIPKSQWTAWDTHSVKIVGDILWQRTANEARSEIARMMELAGVNYGIQEKLFWRKKAALKGLQGKD